LIQLGKWIHGVIFFLVAIQEVSLLLALKATSGGRDIYGEQIHSALDL